MARHKQHIARMEQLLRLLDNEAVEPDDPELLNVKEMMEDYLDRNQEDFDSFDVSCAGRHCKVPPGQACLHNAGTSRLLPMRCNYCKWLCRSTEGTPV